MKGGKRKSPDNPERVQSELHDLSGHLSLTALQARLADLLTWAEREGPAYSDFALALLRTERDARQERRLRRILRRSKLPEHVEGLETFDFSLRPKLEARVVKELLNCRWVEEGRNIICVGRPGLGKSRLLDALAKAACLRGHTVLKIETAQMLENLHGSLADKTFHRTFRRYDKPSVLYCDEFGYAPFDTKDTGYLFRLVSSRHQKRPILLAANTGFKHWKEFFPSEAQAVATVDRLIDRATILRFSGKGFREPKEIIGAESED
jgi:DNA replication protein DnaC